MSPFSHNRSHTRESFSFEELLFKIPSKEKSTHSFEQGKTLALTNGLKDHDDSEEDEEHETYRFKSEVVTARPWYRNLVHIYL